jgi:hypothetical protein
MNMNKKALVVVMVQKRRNITRTEIGDNIAGSACDEPGSDVPSKECGIMGLH